MKGNSLDISNWNQEIKLNAPLRKAHRKLKTLNFLKD